MAIKKIKNNYQKVAMSKPVGKVLDSRVGKVGVKVGNSAIKAVKAPVKIIKKKWAANQAFKNKNATYEQYKSNWK